MHLTRIDSSRWILCTGKGSSRSSPFEVTANGRPLARTAASRRYVTLGGVPGSARRHAGHAGTVNCTSRLSLLPSRYFYGEQAHDAGLSKRCARASVYVT